MSEREDAESKRDWPDLVNIAWTLFRTIKGKCVADCYKAGCWM